MIAFVRNGFVNAGIILHPDDVAPFALALSRAKTVTAENIYDNLNATFTASNDVSLLQVEMFHDKCLQRIVPRVNENGETTAYVTLDGGGVP